MNPTLVIPLCVSFCWLWATSQFPAQLIQFVALAFALSSKKHVYGFLVLGARPGGSLLLYYRLMCPVRGCWSLMWGYSQIFKNVDASEHVCETMFWFLRRCASACAIEKSKTMRLQMLALRNLKRCGRKPNPCLHGWVFGMRLRGERIDNMFTRSGKCF